MKKILVLGGVGAMATETSTDLVQTSDFDEIIIGFTLMTAGSSPTHHFQGHAPFISLNRSAPRPLIMYPMASRKPYLRIFPE